MNTSPAPLPEIPSHAVCAWHPDQPAIEPCGRCGTFACHGCLTRRMDGKGVCPNCAVAMPPLAGRGARFAANMIDQFVWLTIFVPVILLDLVEGNDALAGLVAIGALLTMIVLAGLQLYFAHGGQSIGKKLLKLRVLRTDGTRASLARIVFLRNGVPVLIGSFCGLFSLIDAALIYANDQRCVHDHIADTMVVDVS